MENSVWQVPSQSTPGVVYNLMRKADGSVVCSCPAFSYQGQCKHIVPVDEPAKPKEQPKGIHKDGPVTRSGQHQEGIIRAPRDSNIEDDLLEGKVRPGIAAPTDEVIPLKDVPIAAEHKDNVQEISKIELAKRAAEAIAMATDHYLEWEGPWAVCQSCPWRHSVPLDFQRWDLVNGKPVKRGLAKTDQNGIE